MPEPNVKVIYKKSAKDALKCRRIELYKAELEKLNCLYKGRKFTLHCDRYAAFDNLAIHIFEPGEGPYASLTTNIEELPSDQFALDVNNFPDAEFFCIQNGFAIPTKRLLTSGYCIYPVYQITNDFIENANKIIKEENTNGNKENNKENK